MLDTGQMLLWHVMLLPLILGVLVIAHVVLVRRHGVVPPFDAIPPGPEPAQERPIDAAVAPSPPTTVTPPTVVPAPTLEPIP